MCKPVKGILVAGILAIFSVGAYAQTKVVVIPMAGDESGFKRVSYFHITGGASDNTLSSSYELLMTLATITKDSANTNIKVSFNTQVRQTGVIGDFVEYQLRLNGAHSGSNYSGAVVYMNSNNHHESLLQREYFQGLAAGSYTVELWIRGLASTTSINHGGFRNILLVEEIDLGASAPASASVAAKSEIDGMVGGVTE